MNEPPDALNRATNWAKIGLVWLTVLSLLVYGLCWLAGVPKKKLPPILDKPPAAAVPNEEPRTQNEEPVTSTSEPPPGPMGWSPESVEALAPWTSQQAAFQLVSQSTGEPVSQDNARANVRLWELKRLIVAELPPNGPQLTGDCTSWSTCHAIEGTQAGQMLRSGGLFARCFPPWLYGSGRVWVWRQQIVGPMPSAGCSVAAIAKAAQEYGVLSWDDAKAAGYDYSGQLADNWGRSGPPEKLKTLAAKHKLGTVAPLRSAAELRDAVCNGYGTAFGSDFTGGNFHTEAGRIVADNVAPRLSVKARWHHALCCDGFDGSGSQPWYHIQNSWYPSSHPDPIDGSPACGFWVSESTIDYIVAQGDAFAFSDFEGFTDSRDDILNIFEAEAQPAVTVPVREASRATSERKTTVAP